MDYQNYNYTQKPPKNNNTGLIIAIAVLASVLVIVLIAVMIFVASSINSGETITQDTSAVTSTQPQQPVQQPQQPVQQQPVQQQPTPQPQPQPAPQPQPQPQQPVQQQPASNDKAAKKSAYSARAAQIEEYTKTHLDTATTQVEINRESANVFEQWDVLLNDVYQYLKTIMPNDEFKQLEKDELNWIKEKEKAMKDASAEWGGGSGEPMARYGTASRYTKERCYYLISLIK